MYFSGVSGVLCSAVGRRGACLFSLHNLLYPTCFGHFIVTLTDLPLSYSEGGNAPSPLTRRLPTPLNLAGARDLPPPNH